MIGKCLSKDQFGVMRLLLGGMLDLDFDGCVLFFSFLQHDKTDNLHRYQEAE